MSQETHRVLNGACVVVGASMRWGHFYGRGRSYRKMRSRGRGAILITGATAGIRPWPNSAAFAPAKFAVRGLAQVTARDLHPQGVHVAYVNVDGGINMPLLRKFRPDAKTEDLLNPPAIADVLVSRSSRSQRLDA